MTPLNYPIDWGVISSDVSDFFSLSGIAFIVVAIVAVGLVTYVLVSIRRIGERL